NPPTTFSVYVSVLCLSFFTPLYILKCACSSSSFIVHSLSLLLFMRNLKKKPSKITHKNNHRKSINSKLGLH
ncbi:hypothetical protein BGW37DRAFT_502159, partial [Umbelopsis sp. PMI_123]